MVIPSGTTMVMTEFHTAPRYGRAFYERRDDVNDGFLDSYPRISFKAKDENGNFTRWVLHAGKEWDYEAWTCIPYTGTPTAANDCSPAFDEMEAYNAAYPAIGNILYGFSGRKVSVGPGKFYHTRSHNLHARWDFVGAGAGGAGAVNTSLVFAIDIHGVIVNRHNTDAETVGGAFAYNRADGSSYRLLAIQSLGGTDRAKHGIWMRARGTFEDVYVDKFPGNNVNIVANSSTDSETGTNVTACNANDWQLTRVSVSNSGQHGFYVTGIDANAGHAAGCEVLSAGCGGIVDVSFLGNKWTGCATHSTNSRGLGRVIYSGAVYDLINKTAGIGGSTTPGTNASVWYLTGVSAAADTWGSGNEYIISNCVFSDNVNARSIFDDFYVEGGTCIGHVTAPAIVFGGQTTPNTRRQRPGCSRTAQAAALS